MHTSYVINLSRVLTTVFILQRLNYFFQWKTALLFLLDNIIWFILWVLIQSTFTLSSCIGDFQYIKRWIHIWIHFFNQSIKSQFHQVLCYVQLWFTLDQLNNRWRDDPKIIKRFNSSFLLSEWKNTSSQAPVWSPHI